MVYKEICVVCWHLGWTRYQIGQIPGPAAEPDTGYPAGYMARYPAKPDIRPDIKFNKSLYQSSALLSEKAKYPVLISGRLDIRPAG